MPRNSRNPALIPGIPRLSRSALYAKKGLYKRQKQAAPQAAAAPETVKKVTVGGEKNGGTRLVPVNKAPRFYPAEDIPQPKKSRKSVKPAKLRSSITPGTVLILLAGRFRGKRVVFLKQLESGLLLVTGPFKVNGVPLRRVNQAYVIATSTKIDLGSFKVDEKFNDSYFKKPKDAKKKSTEEEFFEGEKKKAPLAESKVADQKAVDKELLAAINKVPHLRSYLAASFSLTKGQAPHTLLF
ncbi:60S ribosomal protein eL6 [Calcarisporiella thermophila]|uniref:60S ribosomal protein eL6 n=1 Tax=Calcarisporiella thermophila TaxID=911321 RepID=UPI003743BD31